MNADVAPMNADTPMKVFVPRPIDTRNEATDKPKALIRFYRRYIGVHRRFQRLSLA
jgi:hypothetical protein